MKKNAGYFYKEIPEDNSTTAQAQWAAVVTVLSVLLFNTAMIVGFCMAQTSRPSMAPLHEHDMEGQRSHDKRPIPPPGVFWPGL